MADDSKTSWTQGPWAVDYAGTHGHIKALLNPREDRTPTVAQYGPASTAVSLSDDEREANGRLMAAAPKLYDVALALRQHLALFCGPDDAIAAELFRAADDALSLATGKEG